MFQQQNPRRLFQSDMECDDLISKNMCVDAMSPSGTDGGISISDEDQCGCSLDSVVSVAPAEVQRAPPVDAPNASVCGSVRGGSHTARSGQEPYTQEGPILCCGSAVSSGKPRVPYCEKRPGAAHSRRDQGCKSNPLSIVLHLPWLRPSAPTRIHHTWILMKKQALLRV